MSTLKRQHMPAFIGFYALSLIVQVVGAYFTDLSVHSWYPGLIKSPLTPPGMWFGIVWTILYLLMAVAATHAYAASTGARRKRALIWWVIQLLLGLLWSVLFFGNQSVLGGMIVISAVVLAVIITIVLFWRISGRAALLMLPLMLWLILATHLNLFILLHN